MLNAKIIVNVRDPEKNDCLADRWYQVIGTASRTWEKAGKRESGDMFMIVNEKNTPVFVFPSRCSVRICQPEK